MAKTAENTEKAAGAQQIDYKNYFFGRFAEKIPFSVFTVLFIFLVFILPEIIFFEVIYGVSWTNLFWVDQAYINYFPEWWSVQVPHIDLLNILFIFGASITIYLSKGLYNKAYRLKESILKQNYEKGTESYKNCEEDLDKDMWRRFKKWPWILIIIQLIALPFLNFFMLNYAKFLIDPEKTLWMSIESTYSLEFQFFGLAFMVAITFGFGSYLKTASSKIKKEKVNVFHPDRVGGFRGFGEATLRNLFIWTVTYLVIVFVAMENMISIDVETTVQLSFYIWNIFLVTAGLIVSVLIFLNPLRAVRSIIREVKKTEMADLIARFKENYKPILERAGDPYKIAEGRKASFLEGTPFKRGTKVKKPTEEEYKALVRHLNVITWQNYYRNAKDMRDWPWDASIIVKFYFSLIIPILITVLNILVVQVL
jgi:hypothetical protein